MSHNSIGTVKPRCVATMLNYLLDKSALKDDTSSKLYRALFFDIARFSPAVFVYQDFQTLLARRCLEGESFYLETLPRLGKAFEVSLITGENLEVPDGWKLYGHTRLPKFLYSCFSQLWEDDGYPKTNELGVYARIISEGCDPLFTADNVEKSTTLEDLGPLVQNMRQLFMIFSKVHHVCGAKVRKDSLRGFRARIECRPHLTVGSDVLNEARRLIAHVVGADSPATSELESFVKDPWGRHGPGAVAGRERGRDKWMFHTWPGLSDSLFTWAEGKACGTSGWLDKQPVARVVDVPKDFRGPRIICIEPKENQFAQQGLMDALYRTIQGNRLSGRSINFWDTERQIQACKDLEMATIDLSNASDTVSLKLARLLFPRWFFKLTTRFRTRSVMVGDEIVRSHCLATMGNAICFPLETLIFWALSLGTLIVVKDSHRRSGRLLRLDSFVFGDDIIVPLWGAEAVCDTLTSAGCVVNSGKTCLWTPIRESCGEWTWNGTSYTIARPHTTRVSDHRSWLQWSDLLKGQRGRLTPALESEMQQTLDDYHIPKVRYNRKLQRLERLVPMFVQRGRTTELPEYAGLYAWHVGNDRTPILNGARKRVKMGWQALNSNS